MIQRSVLAVRGGLGMGRRRSGQDVTNAGGGGTGVAWDSNEGPM